MRLPLSGARPRGGLLPLLLGGALLAGCASAPRWPALPAPETLSEISPLHSRTLARGDAWLRHYLMEGRADSAAALLAEGRGTAPGDELLRRLQLGLVLHEAGDHAGSNAAFEWAEAEADRRYGRSVSREAGALLINDRVREFVPSRPEMAMIPYYRMLNYLALGERDGALVEARKATAYLERLREGGKQPCVGEGFVLYFTGLVQQSAGQRADALVTLRQAEQAFDACAGTDGSAPPAEMGADLLRAALAAGVGEVADSARKRYRLEALPAAPGPGTGELVVLVEHGWVAHRAETDAHFALYPTDVAGIDDDDDHESILLAAAGVSARLSAQVSAATAESSAPAASTTSSASGGGPWSAPGGPPSALESRAYRHAAVSDADDLYLLRLSWPEMRLEACAAPAVRVVVADTAGAEPLAEEAPAVADVSRGIDRAFASAMPGTVTRMVARGIAKYVMTRSVERKAEKEGGRIAGWLAGAAANLAGNALERADTRSWSLLPDRVSVVRFALPAGEHSLRIEVLRPDGSVDDTLDLGRVTVPAGATVFRSERVWGEEMGSLRREPGPVRAEGVVAADGR